MSWSIVCDFDGTIATEDVTDALLAAFALPGWQDIEAEWLSGRIGSRQCMARQVDLLRITPEALDRFLTTIRIDPAFGEFVGLCAAQGFPLTVVSDGLDYAIRRILERSELGHLPIVANRLVHRGEDRYRLDFPHTSQQCERDSGTCKCAVAKGLAGRQSVLLIGDGTSDFCLAGKADLVFAKGKLLGHCQRHHLPHVACPDFTRAIGLLNELVRPAVADLEFQP